jgi:hypothetical protein
LKFIVLLAISLFGLFSLTCLQVFASEANEDSLGDRDSFVDKYQKVIVAEPFIEMHTGPGRGYPVFHIVEKGEKLSLLKKKTQWYKVESPRGKLGWVHEDEIKLTLTESGDNYQTGLSTHDDFVNRKFESGFLLGDFGGANVVTLYAGWSWTPNIATELTVSDAVGDVSQVQFASLNIMHQPFPSWTVSPYFKIGTGIVHTEPSATLIEAEDRTDEMVHAGLGVRAYMTRNLFIRAEYNSYTILTSRNENDEVEEWKIGLSVFF